MTNELENDDALAKELEEFMAWKRDKELYPPRWTPNEYIQEMLNANARKIVNKIQDIFDNEDPDFLASNSNELTNMIEEIING
jgi:hypothetical protein